MPAILRSSSDKPKYAEPRPGAGGRVLRWLAALLLAVYFITGVSYLALRYVVWPNSQHWLPRAEQALQRSIGRPLEIGGVRTGFDGLRPSLEIEHLSMLDDDGNVAMSARRVHAVVSLRSLATGQLDFARLDLDEPALRVERLAHRKLRVAGIVFDMDRPGSGGDGGGGLDWLLAQRAINLRQAQLQWIDRVSQRELRVEDADLAIGSVGRRHRIALHAAQAPGLADKLSLAVEVLRPAFSRTHDWRQWNGTVHVAAEQADMATLAVLVDELWSTGERSGTLDSGLEDPLPRLAVDGGAAALQLWMEFERGKPSDGLLRLAGRGLALQVAGSRLPLNAADLEAELDRTQAGETHLRLRELALRDADGFELKLAPNARQLLRIDDGGRLAGGALSLASFDSAKLLAIARALPLPAALHERFAPLRVSGEIAAAALNWDGDEAYEVDLRFDRLSFVRDEEPPRPGALGLPSFENVSGSVVLDPSGGRLQLTGRGSILRFPGLFAEPELPLDTLDARARWRLVPGVAGEPAAVDVEIEGFDFAAADAAGQVSGRYRSGGKGLGSVDLQGRLSRADATQVARYLSLEIDEDIRAWVARSIVAGRSDDVRFVLRGDLRDFPFRDPASGEFLVEAAMQDVTLAYWPGWPAIAQIDGRLRFAGGGMSVEASSGRLWGVGLGPVQAAIADFRKALLEIEGKGAGPAQDLLRFLEDSPLRERIEGLPGGMHASGTAKLALDLGIPLRNVASTRVRGAVDLDGNDLGFDPALPPLQKATGRIEFTERKLTLRDLAGGFLGGTLRAHGDTAESGRFRLRAEGTADAAGLRMLADNPLTRALDGSTGWRASFDVHDGATALLIESELEGLASSLPAPLNKPAKAAWPMRAELIPPAVRGDDTAVRDLLRVSLRDDARLVLERERDADSGQARLLRGVFALGIEPLLPDSGMALSLDMAAIDVDAWGAVFGSNPDGGELSALQPSRISLSAGQLRIAGKELNQVVFGATRSDDVWRANVRAKELDGHISWIPAGQAGPPADAQRQGAAGQRLGGVVGRFGRLEIPAGRVGEVESLLDSAPSALPELDVTADDFVLGEYRLGSLALKARNVGNPNAPVWRLEQLRVENPMATLDAHGDWRMPRDGRRRTTSLELELALRDAGGVLDLFGFPGTMRGGSGSLNGSLTWVGSPLALDLPSLSGQLNLALGRGNFLKTDPGIAKLIGVLNLQSLRRRLAFDFHDLFSEGFAFDDIYGTVSVRDGIARSDDFAMRGVTAQVGIRGDVDIVRETQNLLIEVRPEVNAALASLAYAALVNPAVGIGSLLAQMLLREPLREIFAWEYEVTGSWSDPQVTTRSRPTLPETAQPQGG